MSPQDDPQKNSRFESFGRKLDAEFGEATEKVEREADRVITYLNNEVVPAIRNHSSNALRIAAEQLNRLAEFMDRSRSK
jgi:hypothetical protein